MSGVGRREPAAASVEGCDGRDGLMEAQLAERPASRALASMPLTLHDVGVCCRKSTSESAVYGALARGGGSDGEPVKDSRAGSGRHECSEHGEAAAAAAFAAVARGGTARGSDASGVPATPSAGVGDIDRKWSETIINPG